MQTVPQVFNDLAAGEVRPISYGTRISFTKEYDPSVTFFTLDQSVLDGVDLLAPTDDNPLQAWDFYEYLDYSDRLMFLSWQRELEFPFSVVSAIADFDLNNYDDYFTPNSGSPIEEYILPKRPVRLLSGFGGLTIPQFIGLTESMPEIDDVNKTVSFTAMDFLTQIYSMPIRETIAMQDVRTDEVLANIFDQFGLAPTQYDLAKGRNVIPFLFFEQGQVVAGDVIRPLMQAEAGMLWLSEEGIITFRPRLEQPQDPVYTFNDENIVSLKTNGDDQIINQIIIHSEIREVQEFQTVYIKTEGDQLSVIPAGDQYVFKAELTDPAIEVVAPTAGEQSGVSWFTAVLPNGDSTAGVTVVSTALKTNHFEIVFENTNGFDVDINQIELWGRPAKIVDRIDYTATEQPSVDKYEVQKFEINNNFIQSVEQCEAIALMLLDEYQEFASIIEMEVKGNPALQLSDVLNVDYRTYDGLYRIISIFNKIQDGKFTQILKAKHYEPRYWFTLDQSLLDGTDVLAP